MHRRTTDQCSTPAQRRSLGGLHDGLSSVSVFQLSLVRTEHVLRAMALFRTFNYTCTARNRSC